MEIFSDSTTHGPAIKKRFGLLLRLRVLPEMLIIISLDAFLFITLHGFSHKIKDY